MGEIWFWESRARGLKCFFCVGNGLGLVRLVILGVTREYIYVWSDVLVEIPWHKDLYVVKIRNKKVLKKKKFYGELTSFAMV